MDPEIFDIGEENLDQNWFCGICEQVMVNPHNGCREQHSYCKTCIESWMNRNPSCPACRQDMRVEQLVKSRVVDDQIGRLQVRCPKAAASREQDQGSCNWVGIVTDIPSHECGMVEVECRHFACTAKFMRSEIAAHESSCECRTLPCAHCQEPHLARDMEVHISQCGGVQIDCPHGCAAKVPRGNLAHHELACREVTVPCNFAGQGCGRRFKRKRMGEHETEAAAEHAILALRELEECKKNLEEAKEQLKEKDSRISSLKNVTEQQQLQIVPLTTEHKLKIAIPAVSQKGISDPAVTSSPYLSKPFPLPTRRGVYRMRLEAVFSFGEVSLKLELLNVDRAADLTPVSLWGSKISVVGGGRESIILRDFCDEQRAELQPGSSCEAGTIPSPQTGVSTLRDWLDGDALSLSLKLRVTVGDWHQVEMETPGP